MQFLFPLAISAIYELLINKTLDLTYQKCNFNVIYFSQKVCQKWCAIFVQEGHLETKRETKIAC